jgi:glutamyl-tRNA reductase
MHLFALGVSHRTAPIELRERLDFCARGLDLALTSVNEHPSVAGAVIVSTCNRAEIYVTCRDVDAARDALVGFLCDFHDIRREEVAPHLYEFTNVAVAGHLFRVAAGLDSLVVGEPQILGQVKNAYASAVEEQPVGPLLNRLFHAAFASAKRVRTDTGLAEGAVSVGWAAVVLARKLFGRLAGQRVLVVGTGQMGKVTARHLRSQGVVQVMITGRTAARAAELAEALEATAIPWEHMPSALGESDIVITATASSKPVLSRAQVDTAMCGRSTRPLLIIDIAVPRDVDPAAAEVEGVSFYDMDDLQEIVQENLARRATEVARAEAIIAEETKAFSVWLCSRRAIPTLVALRRQFEAIRRTELKRLQPKLAGLPDDARVRVEEITRLIVEKLLLTPTEQLKSIRSPSTIHAYSDALTTLFSLAVDEAVDCTEPPAGCPEAPGLPAPGQADSVTESPASGKVLAVP